jgi:hypothetical protein
MGTQNQQVNTKNIHITELNIIAIGYNVNTPITPTNKSLNI